MGHCRKNVISFFINNYCNLACRYCYVFGGGSRPGVNPFGKKVIDINFAKKGIDDFFEQHDSRKIRFFGVGEPTLELEVMKKIKNYAYKKAGKELYVELQSSGFFNQKVAKWVSKNVDMLWISLDGPQEIQDYYRPTPEGKPSFKTIDRNIKSIDKSKKTTIGFRPTLASKSVDTQKELVDYAEKRGIKTMYCMLCSSFTNKDSSNGVEKTDIFHFADKFIEAREYAEKKGIFYGSHYTFNFDEKVKVACRSLLPMPQLTYDGYVSSCDLAIDGKTPLQDLIYGIYNKKENKITYFPEKIKKIRSRSIHNLVDCQGCSILEHCAGGCAGTAIYESKNFYGKDNESCTLTKYLAKKLPFLINKGYNKSIPLYP